MVSPPKSTISFPTDPAQSLRADAFTLTALMSGGSGQEGGWQRAYLGQVLGFGKSYQWWKKKHENMLKTRPCLPSRKITIFIGGMITIPSHG
jgi:hypothetical protein